MRIREYAAGDAAALAELYSRSVRHYGPRAYAPAQVEAWAATASAEKIAARCEDGRTVLIASDEDDRPLGYGDLEANGHLDSLYCAPEAEGKGVGSALYAALEVSARRQGIGRIYVEASDLARPLFERNGFKLLRRNAISLGGVAIHNFTMEKRLDGAAGDGAAGRPRKARFTSAPDALSAGAESNKRGSMARKPSYPEDAPVGEPAGPDGREADAAADKKGGTRRTRQIVTGAAIGIGSAALVAALLYANRSRKPDRS